MDSFVLPTAVLGAGKAILSSTQTDFAPGLAGLPPLSMPSLTNPLSSAISMVTVQAINNIATSIQNLPAAAPERSSSRSSYSPAMSDSGISVDTGSSSSGSTQSVINLSALSKLGTLNVNGQGEAEDSPTAGLQTPLWHPFSRGQSLTRCHSTWQCNCSLADFLQTLGATPYAEYMYWIHTFIYWTTNKRTA